MKFSGEKLINRLKEAEDYERSSWFEISL